MVGSTIQILLLIDYMGASSISASPSSSSQAFPSCNLLGRKGICVWNMGPIDEGQHKGSLTKALGVSARSSSRYFFISYNKLINKYIKVLSVVSKSPIYEFLLKYL